MKSWIFNYVEVVNVLVWIKQTNIEKVLVEKRYSGSLLFPSIKKINNFILESITKLVSRYDIPE